MARKDTIRYGKKEIPILDYLTVGNRSYAVLDRVGNFGRKRYWVCERQRTGPRRTFRQILILPADQTTSNIWQCCRGCRRAIRISHDLECRRKGAEFYVVTTWIHGEDLRSFLRRTQANRDSREWPSPYEVVKLYRGLTHGLSQLHRHFRVVHGDIRPRM